MENISVSSHYHRNILVLFRSSLAFLLLFEILNNIWVLRFSLDFSWSGLVYTSLIGFIIAEIIILWKKDVNPIFIMAPITIAIFLDAFGDILHLYSSLKQYDNVLHFFNSGLVTYLAFLFFRDMTHRGRLSILAQSLIVASIGITFWTFYEIQEFLEDEFINHRQLRFGDSFDTGSDLLMNTLWCMSIATLLALYSHWYRNKEELYGYDLTENVAIIKIRV